MVRTDDDQAKVAKRAVWRDCAGRSPSPLRGGARGGGVRTRSLGSPPPSILPHKGGGDGAWEAVIVRTESTAPLATPTPIPSPQGGGRRAGTGAGL